MTGQLRQKPHDAEEVAAFQGMGQAITEIRERRDMSREELAGKCGVTAAELETVERGELDESWGVIRRIAKALGVQLAALMIEAEESAPGPGGEAWRQSTREADAGGAAGGSQP
jgi:transcriptional regulator with XRE-family HTH domain